MKIRTGFACAFLIAFSPFAEPAEDPLSEPILRIETGMHTTATSWRIAADEAGLFLVTGSDDKTVRIWELASGKLLRTLRPPIGPGNEGKILAVAISPDGKLVAAGGWTGCEKAGCSIYLFDRETGNLTQRIPGVPNQVGTLAFSRDGKLLAAASVRQELLVYRIEDGKEIVRLRDRGYRENVLALDWDRTGRLVVSESGATQLYSQELKLLAETDSGSSYSARFSPDGSKVAVVSDGIVKILSGTDLHAMDRIYTGRSSRIDVATWSNDGKTIYATGELSASGSRIYRHTDSERKALTELPTEAIGAIVDLVALPQGWLAFGAQDPAWGVLAADGRQRFLVKPELSDFRDSRKSLSVDATGKWIRFGYQRGGKSPALFSVSEQSTLFLGPTKRPHLSVPLEEAPGLFVSPPWEGSRFGSFGKNYLTLKEAENPQSLAVASDGQSFLLGTNLYIRSFDRTGKERWNTFTPYVAYAVNLSGDGRLAVAAFGDGTIHWYRADNGQELLSFFPHADRKRWVAWTPSGYYDASVGGEDLIGWHINRGPNQAADFFPGSQFRDRFYRPDVVARVLDTLDEATALAQADAEARRKKETTTLTKLLPPVVTILAPANESEVREASVPFRVTVRSPSGEPVVAIHVYVDGRPAALARGLVYEPDTPPTDASAERVVTFSIPVPPRDCTVAVSAETRLATSEPVPVRLRWGAAPSIFGKPKLFLLAVGVGTYENPAFNLDLPAKDASDVATSWEAQAGGLYREVQVKLLTNAQATKNGILTGLEWLERETTEKDVAVLFFSGHGLTDPRSGDYLFLPYEANMEARRATLLPAREVRSTLSTIPGKVLLFLDTCHSGNLLGTAKTRDTADLTDLINELSSAENGVVVFSASTGRQQAAESSDWKNGAFTRALIEALSGKADLNGDHSLYITEIESYINRRVKELTGGLQTPVVAKPGGMPDFPVAVWK